MAYLETREGLVDQSERLCNLSYVPLLQVPPALLVAFRAHLASFANKEYQELAISQASPVIYWRDFVSGKEYAAIVAKHKPAPAPTPAAPSSLLCKVVGAGDAEPFFWTDCTPEEYAAILAAFEPLKQAHKWPVEKAYKAILSRLKAAAQSVSPSVGLLGEGEAAELTELVDNFPEINPGNYSDEDACALNNWGIEVVTALPTLLARLAKAEAPATPAVVEAGGGAFQPRVAKWMAETFEPEVLVDFTERGHRFGEEAIELLQANGTTKADVLKLAEYVYSRPVGEFTQEVGGTMVTLAALCGARAVDMYGAAEAEQARVESPEVRAKIQAKQADKRARMGHSPLPGSPYHIESAAQVRAAARQIGGSLRPQESQEGSQDAG